ncbi:MAG: glycosyltransferase family 2 protein [Verrucomicrobiota bacterium]
MLVSIITVSYNSAATIASTVNSVLTQKGVELEYIVVDGASNDGTVDLIRSYGNRINKFVSEPDNGIYDAMNKGLSLATGEFVGILNSDDFYAHSSVLENVVKSFDDPELDCVYGDLDYVDAENTERVVRAWRSKPYEEGVFLRGWHPPHPTFFIRRRVYEALGGFNLGLRIAADYEFMLRVLERNNKSVSYLPEVLVKMRTGGASNRSIKNILLANRECVLAWKLNRYSVFTGCWAVFCKPLRKLGQFGSLNSG